MLERSSQLLRYVVCLIPYPNDISSRVNNCLGFFGKGTEGALESRREGVPANRSGEVRPASTFHQPLTMQRGASGVHRRCNAGAFRTPVTLADARRCRPAQLSSLQKRILCDRSHIADAVAELVSYLSIVPHMRSSDVPPKYSAPLTRGIFSPLDFLCREPPPSRSAGARRTFRGCLPRATRAASLLCILMRSAPVELCDTHKIDGGEQAQREK
jgi:hypothetical protein